MTFLYAIFLLSSACLADPAAPLRPHGSEPPAVQEELRTVAAGAVDIVELPFAPAAPRISNAGVLEPRPPRGAHRVRLAPLRKGTATVELLDEQGVVRKRIVYNVVNNDLSAKVADLRQLLVDAPGLEVRAVNDRIVVDGQVRSAREAKRIAKLGKAYPELLDLTEAADDEACPCAAKAKKKAPKGR